MPVDLTGVTHVIILLAAADNDLSWEAKRKLGALRQVQQDGGLSGKNGRKFAVLTLADFRDENARVQWFLPTDHQRQEHGDDGVDVGEIDTGDLHMTAYFLAAALKKISQVRHVAIGFYSHGTGVSQEMSNSSRSVDSRRPLGSGDIHALHGTRATRSLGLLDETGLAEPARGGGSAALRPRRRRFLNPDLLTPWLTKLGRPGVRRRYMEAIHRAIGPPGPRELRAKAKKWLKSEGCRARGGSSTSVLHTWKLAQALDLAFEWSGRTQKVDVLFLDTCSYGMIEPVYQCRRRAHVVVASENQQPKRGWDYGAWLTRMKSDPPTDAHAWAEQAVDAFHETFKDVTWSTLAAIRTGEPLERVVTAFESLVEGLLALPPDYDAKIRASMSRVYGWAGSASRDLFAFASALESNTFPDGDTSREVRDVVHRAGEVKAKLSAAVGPVVRIGLRTETGNGLALWCPQDRNQFDSDYATLRRLSFGTRTRWNSYLSSLFRRRRT